MITSLDNKTVKELTKLHQKKYRTDSFLLFDQKMIKLAKDNNYLKTLVYVDKAPFDFKDSIEVSREVLNKISKREDLDYLGVSNLIKDNDDYQNRVVILDHLQDPLNVGRIMEASLLFGFDSIILSDNCADIYNEKCLENCKGGIYQVNIKHGNVLEEIRNLKAKGFKVYATGLRNNTKELHEIASQEKMAFVLGNEGSGVSKEVMDVADEILKIDMCNIDSLNVGMAASIIMYEFSNLQ